MAITLTGCSVKYLPRYEQVGAIPPGHVLVVSKVELRPKVNQQKDIEKIFRGQNAIKRGEVKFLTSPNVDKPVKKGAMIPFDINGGFDFNVSYKDFSFILMPPGKTFIRRGEVVLGTGVASVSVSGGGAMTAHRSFRELYLWGDVKVEIPADAKAVYIGNLIYNHDGKYSTKVRVKDDYKKARRALEKQKIPGIKGKDLKKKLARVIKQN